MTRPQVACRLQACSLRERADCRQSALRFLPARLPAATAAATAAVAATATAAAATGLASAATTARPAAAEATAAATEVAGAAFRTGPRLVDRDRAATELRAVELLDRLLGVIVVRHRDERKTAWAAGHAIAHDGDALHGSRLREHLLEFGFTDLIRDVADKQALRHCRSSLPDDADHVPRRARGHSEDAGGLLVSAHRHASSIESGELETRGVESGCPSNR